MTTFSDYVTKNIDYLKTQVGNPEGPNKPNKKKYDPRVCTPPLPFNIHDLLTVGRSGFARARRR